MANPRTHPRTDSRAASPRPDEHDGSRESLERAIAGLDPAALRTAVFEAAPGGYERAVIFQGGETEVVAVRWPADSSTPLHGHAGCAALLRVLSGSLVEHRFVPRAGRYLLGRVELEAGAASFLPPAGFHRVVAVAETVGIHAYSPRLTQPTARVPVALLPELCRALVRDPGAAHDPLLADLVFELRRTT
jgi:hypothetical protein